MNIWGNWNGYEGRKKVKEFGLDKFDAVEWEQGGEPETEKIIKGGTQ